MPRFVRVVPLLLLLPFLAGTHAAEAMPTSALPGFCQLAPDANRWVGLGVGPGTTDQWEDGANWSTGTIPATGDRDVCIPSGGQPRIRGGEEAHLRTLDLKGTLTVDPGGKLFLYGSRAANRDSVVRASGLLDVVGGTLGGISKLHVLGTRRARDSARCGVHRPGPRLRLRHHLRGELSRRGGLHHPADPGQRPQGAHRGRRQRRAGRGGWRRELRRPDPGSGAWPAPGARRCLHRRRPRHPATPRTRPGRHPAVRWAMAGTWRARSRQTPASHR